VLLTAVCEWSKPRAFGQERAPHDAQGEGGIAALQETNGGLHGRGVTRRVREEIRDRRRHLRAAHLACALRKHFGHALDERCAEESEEQQQRRISLTHVELELRPVRAQKARQIRRRGIRRIQLSHRRSQQQDAHRS
jgi:hypothetical protein